MNRHTFLGYLMVFLSAAGFGSYGIWSRLMVTEFDVFYQGWVRSALALAILVPLAYATRSLKPVARKDRPWLLVSAAFGACTQAPLYYAFNHMDIGTATLVFYAMFMVTSYAVGFLAMRERIGPAKLAALALAIVGLAVTFGFSLAVFSALALFMAALNGIASGGEVATTKKSFGTYSSLQIGIYVWAGILVTHLPLSFLLGERWVAPAANVYWYAMLAFAGVGFASFWLVIEGYKHVDASVGGLIGLFEIIFGVAFGIAFFHERLTASVAVGGLLILVAAMLPDLAALIGGRRMRRGEVPAAF